MPDLTEEEQIEAFKRWWAKNGTSTLVGIVLAMAAVAGYQAWQNHKRDRGEAASKIYEQMVDALNVDDPMKAVDKQHEATAKFLAHQLEDSYSGTVYSSFGALYLARIAVEDGDLKAAERELKWALDHGLDDSLTVIVKMRLARVQLATGKPDQALKTLDGVEPGEYRPSYAELKGDIYHSMGDEEKAREAYERAINALGTGDVRPLLKMKLDQLQSPTAVVPDKAGTANDGAKHEAAGKSTDAGATTGKSTGNGAK